MDLGYTDNRFTWSNNKHLTQHILERLDRYVANYDRINMFPEASVHHLSRIHSDHSPLLLNLHNHKAPNEKQLRFETIWTTHPQFSSIITNNWAPTKYILIAIKDFTKEIMECNRTTFDNIFKNQKILLARIQGIQNSPKYITSLFLQYLEHDLIA